MFDEIMKKADWYYDFCDGDLRVWITAKKSYDAAIEVIRHSEDPEALILKWVPTTIQGKVRDDYKRPRVK